MARAFVLVLDSLGIGALPDAERFGDQGSNTLLHIAQQHNLHIPNLCNVGLSHALQLACGEGLPGVHIIPDGAWAAAAELSAGKDTPSGHWEMMGIPVVQEWGLFPAKADGSCFPPELLHTIAQKAGLDGWLGDCHSSGTEIIKKLGEEHVRTGKPIFYTSADSVFQVACHEEAFGLERLYSLCETLRTELDTWRIGRVIARPFTGNNAADFVRTTNRRDYTMPPPAPTVLDNLVAAGGTTVSIGKIADIFAHQGISHAVKAHGTEDLFAATIRQTREAPERSIVMTNFVDFDQSFGHRRDGAGYARELELFDGLLPQMQAALRDDDLLLLTADHGCDPTWTGTDHTREYVPQLAWGRRVRPGSLGIRTSFADLGQTVAAWIGLPSMEHGQAYDIIP